jgi:hypothetical protein
MGILEMSEEERKKILQKHKTATKEHYLKKEEDKKGLQKPKTEQKKPGK